MRSRLDGVPIPVFSAPRRKVSDSIGLWILYAFTVVSLLEFATFGLHPELLRDLSPASLDFYAVSFRFFAIGQVWLAGLVLAVFLTRHVGTRWISALLVVYSLS